GLAVAVGALRMMLGQKVASAALPTLMVSNTVKAASLFAAGRTAAAGLISAKAAALTEGVLQTMLLDKLKVVVAVLLAVGALGIGATALPHAIFAADPPPAVSKSAVPGPDQDNLKETVLALEKRIWEAHTKQDVNTFKNLLADDYAGTDRRGRLSSKKEVLSWVTSFRVLDPVMTNTRVVVLNATSAIVTYEIRYRIASPGGQELETPLPAQATSGWAVRDGKWWCVYSEASALGVDGARSKATGANQRGKAVDTWDIKPIHFRDYIGLSDTKMEVVTEKDMPQVTRLRIRLPAPADT